MDSSSTTTSRKSNKIRDIVRLQQILKKWKKAASSSNSSKNNNVVNSTSAAAAAAAATTSAVTSSNKSIKFLKKTLSFSERERESSSSSSSAAVPKGYVAVCVGKELKRFVIPTEYLRHQMFGILLREAEEEFGFQQEGVLKFPCEVELFEKIVKMMEDKKRSMSSPSLLLLHDQYLNNEDDDEKSGLINMGMGDHVIINSNINDVVVVYSPDTTAANELHPRPQMCR